MDFPKAAAIVAEATEKAGAYSGLPLRSSDTYNYKVWHHHKSAVFTESRSGRFHRS